MPARRNLSSVLAAPLVALGLASAPTPASAEGLHGSRPTQPIAVPEFQATNSDGQPRTRQDLLGHPTVLWFFPMAGTPG